MDGGRGSTTMVTVLGRGTVLVADEDRDRSDALKARISAMGYSVSVQPSARAALRKIRARAVSVVIISASIGDMHMAGFLETITRANLSTGIVIYGRSVGASDAVAWMKAGAVDILLDIDGEQALRSAIQRAFSFSVSSQIESSAAGSGSSPEIPVMLYRSRIMDEVLKKARKVAPVKATVLITGESGTGKDVLARQIHAISGRRGAYLALNCAAIPETLLEDELFGHDRGAFTGADRFREGKFEAANGGTLLLDEIGEIPLSTQVKLLRILEENMVTRLGGNTLIPIDVRLIAATNSDLQSAVRKGMFREDLFYRLKVVEIHIPPLRARRSDIPVLAISFLREAAERHGLPLPELSQETLERLMAFGWPGNVRQLRNLMESLLIISGGRIGLEDLPAEIAGTVPAGGNPSAIQVELPMPLADLEKMAVEKTLALTGGNRTRAAELLGIGRRTLQRKLKGM
jgi:two-component system, NtrC family, response regulator HydG